MKKIDANTIKLIQESLDGTLSPEGETRLQDLLQKSEAANDLYRQLAALDQQIKTEQPEKYEVDVTDKVMQQIAQKHRESFSVATFLESISTFFAAFRLQHAIVALAGILIGSIATFFLTTTTITPDVEMISGTMAAKRGEAIALTRDHTTVKIIPYAIEKMVYINFMINTRDDVEVVMSYDDLDFSFRNANYISATGNQYTDFGRNTVSFGALGRTNFQMILERTSEFPAKLDISVVKESRPLISQEIFFE